MWTGGYLLHFIIGITLTTSAYFWRPMIFSAYIAGIGKEVFDYLDYGRFSMLDMNCTFAGAFIGLCLLLFIQKNGTKWPRVLERYRSKRPNK